MPRSRDASSSRLHRSLFSTRHASLSVKVTIPPGCSKCGARAKCHGISAPHYGQQPNWTSSEAGSSGTAKSVRGASPVRQNRSQALRPRHVPANRTSEPPGAVARPEADHDGAGRLACDLRDRPRRRQGDELRALRRLHRENPTSLFVFVSQRGSPFTTAGFACMTASCSAATRPSQRQSC
jgi:hypothetical protein